MKSFVDMWMEKVVKKGGFIAFEIGEDQGGSLETLMKEAGLVNRVSEVRRNQPKLCVTLDKLDFVKVKWGKKFLFILVGE